MKYLSILLTVFLLQFAACTKNNNSDSNGTDGPCKMVTITSSATGCNDWGIVVNGVKYPSANIPDEFKQDGIAVCATYTLYEDMRACACCGGTWADIKSMKRYIR